MPIAASGMKAGEFWREGARLLIRVDLPRDAAERERRENRPLPPVQEVRAILDTGASQSGIDLGVARALGLEARNWALIRTPAGSKMQPCYDVSLRIPEVGLLREITVFGLQLAPRPYRALLGRDILSLGTLIYSGWKGGFEFCV